mgnify:FL=1
MKSLGLYSTDIAEINNKVEKLGLKDIFSYSKEPDKLKVKLEK